MTTITAATEADVDGILAVLRANRGDPSLFQQSRGQVAAAVGEFVVARDGHAVVGCTQVHPHPGGGTELLAVAVAPRTHGRGVGGALVRRGVVLATAAGARSIWLGTAKPGYFARHGFVEMSRWRLPLSVLVRKLRLVFRQPVGRWLPAIFGRHVFMRLGAGAEAAAAVRSRRATAA